MGVTYSKDKTAWKRHNLRQITSRAREDTSERTDNATTTGIALTDVEYDMENIEPNFDRSCIFPGLSRDDESMMTPCRGQIFENHSYPNRHAAETHSIRNSDFPYRKPKLVIRRPDDLSPRMNRKSNPKSAPASDQNEESLPQVSPRTSSARSPVIPQYYRSNNAIIGPLRSRYNRDMSAIMPSSTRVRHEHSEFRRNRPPSPNVRGLPPGTVWTDHYERLPGTVWTDRTERLRGTSRSIPLFDMIQFMETILDEEEPGINDNKQLHQNR